MKKRFIFKTIVLSILFLGLGFSVFAADTRYTLLEPEVFGQDPDSGYAVTSFSDYANQFFKVLLSASIALAILMIVIGGFQYVTSATGSGKGDGKQKILDALTGLVLILISYLILKTINPKLVEWDFKVEPLGPPAVQSSPTNPVR